MLQVSTNDVGTDRTVNANDIDRRFGASSWMKFSDHQKSIAQKVIYTGSDTALV